MANEVCTSLGLSGKDLSGKLLQIVEEHGSSASFMINSLMWNALQSNRAVCLLALHNSSAHYQKAAKKLGFNLKEDIDNKTAVVLEPYKIYVGKTGNLTDIDMRHEENLKRLFLDVKAALNSLSGKKCLIIDDLSDLLSLGSNITLLIAFFHYCQSLQETDKDLTMIICTHCAKGNQEQELLSNFIAHIADCKMTVAGLKSGFSPIVTGRIEVVNNLEREYSTDVDNTLFHFRLTDRQVKVFAPGTAGFQR